MEKEQGLRLYCFQNMYLSGIQAGIQSQHSTTELFVKYQHTSQRMLMDWACNHKTTIVLNGGMANNLEELKSFLEGNVTGNNVYPWAYFNESQEALGGCITNVCIVVPEKIYNFNLELLRINHNHEYTDTNYILNQFEFELAKRIKSCRLKN